MLINYDVEPLIKNLVFHENSQLAEDAEKIHKSIVQGLGEQGYG